MSGRRLRAVRGAISVDENTSAAIRRATSELLAGVMARNDLAVEDLISVIFTATHDLTADFPAVAAREMGLSEVPLLCAQELPVEGSMPRCVRVLVHCDVPAERTIRHVYLRGARQLRTDLPE